MMMHNLQNMKVLRANFLKLFLIVFLICDLTISFIQYYNTPIYGDMESGILPDNHVQKILDDPLGFKLILTGDGHINPNRFFSHFIFMKYFQNVPSLLSIYFDPITSIYLACALIKFFVQLLFILALTFLVSNSNKLFSFQFILIAAIIAPLFQVYGFFTRMGIVDKSVAYTFFYGLPVVLLMLFMLPIFRCIIYRSKLNLISFILLLPFTIILPLSGPLIPGIILIINSLILIHYVNVKSFKVKEIITDIPVRLAIILLLIGFWSIYSLLLGQFDANYKTEFIPVFDRYLNLPYGIYSQLFHSLGFPLMISAIVINILIISKNSELSKYWNFNQLKWVVVFTILYILLLPLGGYRPYRPYIIRFDTIIPVTIAFIYLLVISTVFIINHLKNKNWYVTGVILVLLIYTFADFKGFNENKKEKFALELIVKSSEKIVALPWNYYILSWDNITDAKDSEQKAELLLLWNIINEKKLFYNDPKQIEKTKP